MESKGPTMGMNSTTKLITNRARKTTRDCIAWNLTNRFFFSSNKKIIPVSQPKT